jgi:hypothetical protein
MAGSEPALTAGVSSRKIAFTRVFLRSHGTSAAACPAQLRAFPSGEVVSGAFLWCNLLARSIRLASLARLLVYRIGLPFSPP